MKKGPFKLRSGNNPDMQELSGVSPMRQDKKMKSKFELTNPSKDKIIKGEGGERYVFDSRSKEGDLGGGMTDLVYRPPHIYRSKKGSSTFEKLDSDSPDYKRIKKRHQFMGPKFPKPEPLPKNLEKYKFEKGIQPL